MSQRKKKIPNKPRFNFVTETAYQLLVDCDFTAFPVNVDEILDYLQDFVTCFTWTQAKFQFNVEDPFCLKASNADGRTVKFRDSSMYIVIYDIDDYQEGGRPRLPERVNWTIMHEIGHILLGHLVEFEETSLNRLGLDDDEYAVLEVEANYFAAEVLAPTLILKFMRNLSVNQIVSLFDISTEAARKKYTRAYSYSYTLTKWDVKVLRNFYDFLVNDSTNILYEGVRRMWEYTANDRYLAACRKCQNCRSYITDPDAKYCPSCGVYIDLNITHRKKDWQIYKVNNYLRDTGIAHTHFLCVQKKKTIDNKVYDHLMVCPHCLNNRFSEDDIYCPECGHPLVNMRADGKIISCIEDRYCSETGMENLTNKWYDTYEKRYYMIMSIPGEKISRDYVYYTYWGFLKYMLRIKLKEDERDLLSALLYSAAFIDDHNVVHVYTDSKWASETIHNEKETLISYLNKIDDVKVKDIDALGNNTKDGSEKKPFDFRNTKKRTLFS